MEQDQEINLKALKDIIGAGDLSFVSSGRLMENLGTDTNVIYLKKVDESVEVTHGH